MNLRGSDLRNWGTQEGRGTQEGHSCFIALA